MKQVGVVCGNDKTEDEEANNVEESDTPEDLLDSLGKGLSGVGRLCGCETDQFSATEGERSGNEDTAEALEAIAEGVAVSPVCDSNVASRVGGHSANVNDDTEDNETNAGHDLDNRKNELNLAICSHTEELDSAESNEEDSNPHTNVDVGGSFPEVDGDRSSSKFERKNSQPLNGVLPADSETPRLRDETACIAKQNVSKMNLGQENDIGLREECSVNRIEYSQLSQRLHGTHQHYTDD